MSRPKRPSVSGVFPGVELPAPRSPRKSLSPSRRRGLANTLGGSFSRGWPNWERTMDARRMNFTIKMDDVYRKTTTTNNPEDNFDISKKHIEELVEILNLEGIDANDIFLEHLEDMMVEAIFGSNYIERAGSTYNLTLQICRQIFQGHHVSAEVEERNSEYQEGLKDLYSRGLLEQVDDVHKVVVRSRREIIQHALALEHMVNAIVHKNELLTEKLILETHRILCTGIDHEDGSSWTEYAGRYRDGQVAVQGSKEKKPHLFIHARAVPEIMTEMCQAYKRDVRKIEETLELDPFTFAARYAWYYVNIHPFWDGNGRMCRLILNAILLKYAGIIAPIGENGEPGRNEYLKISTEGGKSFLAEDFVTPTTFGHSTLGALVIEKATTKLKQLTARLRK